MIRKTETIAMTVLFIAVHCTMALGQAPPPTILVIDLENYVDYQDDIGVPSKYATNPNIPPVVTPTNFFVANMLGESDFTAPDFPGTPISPCEQELIGAVTF